MPLSRDPFTIPITDPLDPMVVAELLAMAYHEGYVNALNSLGRRSTGMFPGGFADVIENIAFNVSATHIVQTRIADSVKATNS